MAKKTRVTPIISDKPDLKMMTEMLKMELAHMDAPLATDDEVNHAIATVTNRQSSMDRMKTYGRPLKEAAIGRVKFTTALQNHYVKWLKIQAAETGVSVADVVEKAIAAYKHEKDMNR
jgi:hypothetical protein